MLCEVNVQKLIILVIATRNKGKTAEIKDLLQGFPVEIKNLDNFGPIPQLEEDGETFDDNAYKKASFAARILGFPALADDSGLEVDALEGAPGVRSARYTPGRDGDRVAALLAQLRDVPWERRTARFRCVVVIATPTGELYSTEGVREGLIAFEPAGQGGFGYDPVFYLPDYGCTMAQLPQAEKNRISHRAQAIEMALPILGRLLA